MIEDVFMKIILPPVVGFMLFYVIHEVTGFLVLNLVNDEDKIVEEKLIYFDVVLKIKDIFFFWGLGALLLILAGF